MPIRRVEHGQGLRKENRWGCNGFDQFCLDRYAHGEGIYLAGIHLQTSPFELESLSIFFDRGWDCG